MSNPKHLEILAKGVKIWNKWRSENTEIIPDLSYANLHHSELAVVKWPRLDDSRFNLTKEGIRVAIFKPKEINCIPIDFQNTNLEGAILFESELRSANLEGANLAKADLSFTNLYMANLSNCCLDNAKLNDANLTYATLHNTDMQHCNLKKSSLSGATLKNVNLSFADLDKCDLGSVQILNSLLHETNFSYSDICSGNLKGSELTNVNLSGADLQNVVFDDTNIQNVNFQDSNLKNASFKNSKIYNSNLNRTILTNINFDSAEIINCSIYGSAAWNLSLEKTKQLNLRITPENESIITVDNLEVAQFIHLLLDNKKIRNVIDTITSKVVLILGRFTDKQKHIFDTIKEYLRYYNYLPVLFDFQKSNNRDFIETVSLLAHISRFVIADMTDPKIILEEDPHIVRNVTVPLIPIKNKNNESEPVTLINLRRNHKSLLKTFEYRDKDELILYLKERVIDPAEKLFTKLSK